MYQSSIGEDHSQCNIPSTITGDPRPLQVLLFDVAAGFGDLRLNLIGTIHWTGKPWLMNLRSSTWGMAGYGLSMFIHNPFSQKIAVYGFGYTT